jgi:hypothetical protein
MGIITWDDKTKHFLGGYVGGLISHVTNVLMQESPTAENKELFGIIYA